MSDYLAVLFPPKRPAPIAAAWRDESNVFGVVFVAEVGPLTLTVESVIGGSNADREPFGWSVYAEDGLVDEGAVATWMDGQRQAEAAASRWR